MLEDLSAHLLDIAENSVMANSTDVRIVILEKRSADRLTFSVEDNGKGMTEDFVAKVTDPFTTTRTTRRVGMGLPFLRQSAELCEGGLNKFKTRQRYKNYRDFQNEQHRQASAGRHPCHNDGSHYGFTRDTLDLQP